MDTEGLLPQHLGEPESVTLVVNLQHSSAAAQPHHVFATGDVCHPMLDLHLRVIR